MKAPHAARRAKPGRERKVCQWAFRLRRPPGASVDPSQRSRAAAPRWEALCSRTRAAPAGRELVMAPRSGGRGAGGASGRPGPLHHLDHAALAPATRLTVEPATGPQLAERATPRWSPLSRLTRSGPVADWNHRSSPMKLTKKTAIVTGGSSGIRVRRRPTVSR